MRMRDRRDSGPWMPPRSTPPRASVYPSNDNATYRDLLYFEERLKTNATRLQRRKARYQLFLLQLLLIIAFLLAEVLLPPEISILAIPYKFVLQRVLPDIYTPDGEVTVHPYLSTGLLFVSVTTLVLFFASGMYSEKIAYANKYVPQANRALRSFNMYLNVRKPPLRSKFYFNPLSFFFPRPQQPPAASSKIASRPPSPTRVSRSRSSSTLPIPSIPPASNPRGELIFSSRVDRNFQESYERYRAQFERRREEKGREANKIWWREKLLFWGITPSTSTGNGPLSPTTMPQLTSQAIRTASTSSSSSRGRGSRSGTPPVAPGSTWGGGAWNAGRQKERSRSPAPVRRGTSPPSPILSERGRRDQGGDERAKTLPLERRGPTTVLATEVYPEERTTELRE